MKESYAEYKETYEAYKKADGKEAFIDGLIIDSALERGDFAMIDHEKVVSDNYKNDTLVYEEKNDDITDITQSSKSKSIFFIIHNDNR